MCHCEQEEASRELPGVGFILPSLYGLQELNSGHQSGVASAISLAQEFKEV